MTARTQPVRTVPGQTYGKAGEQAAQQQAIPLPDNRTPPVRNGVPQGPPVQRPDMFGPTQRPGEPLTAGAATGAGPSDLGMLPDDPLEFIRALILNGYGGPGLRRLLDMGARQ